MLIFVLVVGWLGFGFFWIFLKVFKDFSVMFSEFVKVAQ